MVLESEQLSRLIRSQTSANVGFVSTESSRIAGVYWKAAVPSHDVGVYQFGKLSASIAQPRRATNKHPMLFLRQLAGRALRRCARDPGKFGRNPFSHHKNYYATSLFSISEPRVAFGPPLGSTSIERLTGNAELGIELPTQGRSLPSPAGKTRFRARHVRLRPLARLRSEAVPHGVLGSAPPAPRRLRLDDRG
jgi:hypothetical protein